jgi:DNA-binding NarL/FixJ family response regulator
MEQTERERVLAAYLSHARRFDAIAARRHRPGPDRCPTALAARTPPTARPLGDLSGRELEVLTLLSEGSSNREIGRRLFISEETVKSHVRNVLIKLDARNRAHAVGIACRRRLLPDHTARSRDRDPSPERTETA